MADISATIRTLSIADSDVSALVGTRMYSDVLPQKCTMPAIAYQVISTVANEELVNVTALTRARIQIDCFAKTRGEANQLAEKVRIALHKKHRGNNSGQWIDEISLAGGEEHEFVQPEAGTDQRRFITSQDFFVFYQTTTS